ncbi:hypothetical protein CUJ84_pRLN3000393 (plasmid) [Rhizobium leguminosarum]|uniref:Uncharacterized protein n=1 Tax=Rhizobium leguminosarum TaxID=384 RepID=A0A2K9ZGX7_RHILE|nr:hypothetical protein CUJ84_pRLN3000393 [Rhizobium leguminosarum]
MGFPRFWRGWIGLSERRRFRRASFRSEKVDESVMVDGRIKVAESLRKLIANLVTPDELRASGLKFQIALLPL